VHSQPLCSSQIGVWPGGNPPRDYFAAVEQQWDDIERLDTWLTKYAGAEDTELTRAYGAISLLAVVRRVRRPGAKFDGLLTLLGPQGAGKSKLLRILTIKREWFDDVLQLGGSTKETIEQTAGKLIVEISELTGLKRDAEPVNRSKNGRKNRSKNHHRDQAARAILDQLRGNKLWRAASVSWLTRSAPQGRQLDERCAGSLRPA
jgi:hypothetical protein